MNTGSPGLAFGSPGDDKEVRNYATWYQISFPFIDPETYNDVRIVAPGYDPYWLEQEWRNWWVDTSCAELKNPDKAFVGFCRRYYERHGKP